MGIESLIILLVVGAIAGWLAGVIMKGYGFGLIGNIVVGIVGAFLGNFIARRHRALDRRRHHRRDHQRGHRRGDPAVHHRLGEALIATHKTKFEPIRGGAIPPRICF